jgi:hypothetical protein
VWDIDEHRDRALADFEAAFDELKWKIKAEGGKFLEEEPAEQ